MRDESNPGILQRSLEKLQKRLNLGLNRPEMATETMGTEQEFASSGVDPVETFYTQNGLEPELTITEITAGQLQTTTEPDAGAEDLNLLNGLEPEHNPEAVNSPETGNDRSEQEHDLGSFAAVAARAAESVLAADDDIERVDRSKEVFQVEWDESSFEVRVDSKLTLEDYKRETPPEVWGMLMDYMDELKGKSISFVNPTMQGGGVAIMRPAKVHLINLIGKEQEKNGVEKGVEAHWFKLADHKELKDLDIDEIENPFLFTKQMHNINQRRQLPEGEERITDDGKDLHQQWCDVNWDAVLSKNDTFVNTDIMVVDDPQPVPLIPKLREVNPDQLIFWRDHIDTNHKPDEYMEDPTTPQGEVWQYLWEMGIKLTDGTFVHPVKSNTKGNGYGPDLENTYVAPAVLELNDDLNRELNEEEIEEGFNFINSEIEAKNRLLRERGEYNKIQELVDPERDIILLVARFDESKGMDHAIKLGAQTRELMREQLDSKSYEERADILLQKRGDQLRDNVRSQLSSRLENQGIHEDVLESLVEVELDNRIKDMVQKDLDLPQVVIIGNGSIDDPSGDFMLKRMYEEQNKLGAPDEDGNVAGTIDDRNNTIIMRLKHNYQAINAMMYKAKLLMQTSEAEGMETRISDGIRHGLYSVVFNNGGMSTQVVEGLSGEILDFQKPDHDLGRGANIMAGLLLDPQKLEEKRKSTLEEFDRFNRVDFAIPMGLLRFARAFAEKSQDRNAKADELWLHGDMLAAKRAKKTKPQQAHRAA